MGVNWDKEALKKACIELIENKLNVLKVEISQAQASSNEDTKSSAGDKHETGRAMAQLEVERLSAQYETQNNLYKLISGLPVHAMSNVQAGSLVITDKGIFYPSAAIGILKHHELSIMTLGMSAPLTQSMLSKQKGANFSFNGNKYHIMEIF